MSERTVPDERLRHLFHRYAETGALLGFEGLCALWREPHRRYHALWHLADCIGRLETLHLAPARTSRIAYALFFHDAIYDPGHPESEERSAMLALAAAPVSADREFLVTAIRATKHHQPDARRIWGHRPDAEDLFTVLDIDLAGLADDQERFDESTTLIREEFQAYDDRMFWAGRAHWIDGMLARPWIYATDHYRAQHETRARDNLKRELAAAESRARLG